MQCVLLHRPGIPLLISVELIASTGALLAIQDNSLRIQLNLKQRSVGKSQFVSGTRLVAVSAGAACSCARFQVQIINIIGSQFVFEATHPTGTRTGVGISPTFAVVPYSIR